ncbi:PRAME family member 12-like [Nycticebus coucang]|uniref:PRAME family member 12-like n=1 Tax=Nycticebus coucang TaxID=9470 RepID=UPI00234C5949|nr:PRAME family member 12-like [Nycticebus coucang]
MTASSPIPPPVKSVVHLEVKWDQNSVEPWTEVNRVVVTVSPPQWVGDTGQVASRRRDVSSGCFLCRFTKMSLKGAPRLLDLAVQSLVRNEALAISALEELPRELFPPLFMEAFTRRRSRVLTAMVQAWPFTCLPLGSLMKSHDLKSLRAVLDGLDALLLPQKFRPRRWILQVLDLRDVDENFWTVWSEAVAPTCSTNALGKRKTGKDCPRLGREKPFQVIVDLCLTVRTVDESLIYVSVWARQRKDFVHLCCRKLNILAGSLEIIRSDLKTVELECIQEVEVNCHWKLPTLGRFASYLGRMTHLQTLLVSHVSAPAYLSPEMKKKYLSQFATSFLKLDRLQALHMHSDSFLEGHLDQVLRCLKTPLETLSMNFCSLVESDMSHLSWCPTLSQLKHLVLTNVRLTDFSPEPLQLLLERVAVTLQTLDLDDCGISDAQLRVILPSLSCCFQLTTFSFCGNQIFMPALEDLVRHTVALSKFRTGQYPAPLESYDASGTFYQEILARFVAKLRRTLRDLQSKSIFFGIVPCPECGNGVFYDLDMVRY